MILALARDTRVDWARMLFNLQRAGLTMGQIGELLGVSRRTLGNYVRDYAPAEPAFWIGWRLILLWCDRCGGRLEDVPLCKVTPSVSQVLRGR